MLQPVGTSTHETRETPALAPEKPKRGNRHWRTLICLSHHQEFIAFLQFARASLKSLIPRPYDFEPRFLHEHIKKKRLTLGLLQREVADQIGIRPWTILNWEKGHMEPLRVQKDSRMATSSTIDSDGVIHAVESFLVPN